MFYGHLNLKELGSPYAMEQTHHVELSSHNTNIIRNRKSVAKASDLVAKPYKAIVKH